jgi:hypothetical protein
MSVTKMSLDNTSHPGRPGRDELVPSRYVSIAQAATPPGTAWSAWRPAATD